MNSMNIWTLGLGLWAAVACSPNSQFNSSNMPDYAKEVNARAAGMKTGTGNSTKASSGGAEADGLVNIECFTLIREVTSSGSASSMKSVGIPSNCARSLADAAGADNSKQMDIAVVLDISRNMGRNDLDKNARAEITKALTKLQAEKRIASLTAVAVGDSVREPSIDIERSIKLISGELPEWATERLISTDELIKNPDLVMSGPGKPIFQAAKVALKRLTSEAQSEKIFIMMSNSLNMDSSEIVSQGEIATGIKSLAEQLSAKGGQLISIYASSESNDPSLPKSIRTPIQILDQVFAAAGVAPVRSLLGQVNISGLSERIAARASKTAASSEACLLSSLEAFDASGGEIFKKDIPTKDRFDYQNITLPKILHGTSFKLIVTRTCEKSGEKTSQTVEFKSVKESMKK